MPKRKAAEQPNRLFQKKSSIYVKPPSTERVIGLASSVWADIKDLDLSSKPVSRWTLKQKESFIRAMNKYSCVTSKGDFPNADVGDLYSIMEKANRYLLGNNDDEMRTWLDPDYVVVDWVNTNEIVPSPNLAVLVPPLSAVIAVTATAQSNCYLVPNREDGEFLLGILTQRFPGCMGFVVSSPIPLLFRS